MTASLIYNGALRCTAVHNQSGSGIETDAPTDNRGKGERFSPTDLTATSLGLCLITTMAIKATDMGIELAGATVDVQKHMSKEPPRRIVKIEVWVKLPALEITDKDRQILEAAGNACPVARSLHPDLEQVISYQWG
ncbi:OsmC family protein [Phnomibacter ginsenosidimutans]|uniref:OsmC family peroxiredoxin n=1 Tax=Phnomibacter ginsenosidimutans TaxID=2676868 RepID=A0A6I6G589_9BACT|nr:OsmC family protein [Phnomibacter ginsenosidimutans]QGW27826.1 OsmC family peroxiredoxin [Phnomibacter ginsenosidimutans]